jgi:hypothetical protein
MLLRQRGGGAAAMFAASSITPIRVVLGSKIRVLILSKMAATSFTTINGFHFSTIVLIGQADAVRVL